MLNQFKKKRFLWQRSQKYQERKGSVVNAKIAARGECGAAVESGEKTEVGVNGVFT